MEMAFVIRQKSRDARMRQLAITMRTPRTTMALASSWMHVESVVAMASLLAPATAQEMYWMPAVFVVARA
jgi:hypothetical protein